MAGAEPYGTYAPGLATRIVLGLSQNTPLGRGKARRLLAKLVRHLNAERLDARLFGLNARLHMQNNSSEIKALMNPGRYSKSEFAFGREHMPATGGVFVDIGANAGLFSLGIASHMRSGMLIAAEPQPGLYARLQANLVELNAALPERLDMHLLQTAIGAEAGELGLSVPDQLGQASARELAGAQRINVPVRPLADVLAMAGAKRVDLLKIDVEGFEDEILFSFFETAPLALYPGAIVLEHCHRDRWTRDCEALLIGAGYRCVASDRTNLMLRFEGR